MPGKNKQRHIDFVNKIYHLYRVKQLKTTIQLLVFFEDGILILFRKFIFQPKGGNSLHLLEACSHQLQETKKKNTT